MPKNVMFSDDVMEKALKALKNGACMTDTQWQKRELIKRHCRSLAREVYCFMSDEEVAGIYERKNGADKEQQQH
ncbi:MAG: precorrin-8X methylmutase [Lachnospiraceae bacterium]